MSCRYKYRVESPVAHSKLQAILNSQSEDGWRLSQLIPIDDFKCKLILEMEVNDDETTGMQSGQED